MPDGFDAHAVHNLSATSLRLNGARNKRDKNKAYFYLIVLYCYETSLSRKEEYEAV